MTKDWDDSSLKSVSIDVNPSEQYSPTTRLWQGIPGIAWVGEKTLWATWYSGGRTWSEGEKNGLPYPNSRFCVRRLASGRLLMVNHPRQKTRHRLI